MLRIIAGDLLMALNDNDPEVTHYLDRETGDVIPIFGDMFGPDDPEYIDEEDLMENPRYAVVEPVPSHDAFRWMEQFASTIEDDTLRVELYEALERRRPFRGFKDVLLSYPTERKAWFAYHENRLVEEAHAWLRSEGIVAELVLRGPQNPQEFSPLGLQ
jgi:hypothetical protein